jgi:hypothetical protein
LSFVTLVVEGTTDAAVARRLLLEAGLKPHHEYVTNGKSGLDERLSGYNNAARFACWLVLRDLDQDFNCAPDLLRELLPAPAAHMRLHVPVRAIEAWLLADPETLSRSLSVPVSRVPADPETVPHPKRALVDLARRSRKRAVREALVPAEGTTARVGPGYSGFLTEFATNTWRPDVAATRSQSLARLRTFLLEVS